MNNFIQKIIIPTVMLTLIFMIPARAVETPAVAEQAQQSVLPKEMAFSIPANNYCSPEDSLDFSFQLSNAGDAAADVTLSFYMQDGTEFTSEGSSYREIGSTLVPGQPVTLKAHATGLYHINFGNHKTCGERIYLGKITAHSGQASLLAQGWISTGGRVETIAVNDNKKFDLAVPETPVKPEAAAVAAPVTPSP